MRSKGLADALFTRTQQGVLAILFGNPGASFHTQDIIRRARTGTGSTLRELVRLEESGLITSNRVGRQKHYQANPDAPLFHELASIIQKTVGLAEPLRRGLRPLERRIYHAFIYGSVAKGDDHASSDVDVMIVSDDVTYAEVFEVLDATARDIGRRISPTVYTSADFAKRLRSGNPFVRKVMERPKIWLIGSEHDLLN